MPTAPTFTIGQIVQGATRTFFLNGETYIIAQNPRPPDLPMHVSWDAWKYTLPTGETYSHPTQFGALMLCLKHLGGNAWTQPTNPITSEPLPHA